MAIIFRHFWLVLIAVTCANAAIWWHRGKEYRERDPSLEAGYRRLVRGLVIWGNVPWVVMGLGILSGSVSSVFGYFEIRDGGLYVSAFFASIILQWIAGTWWIFFGNGADELIRHPGLSNVPLSDPRLIKAMWIVGVLSGVIGFGFLIALNPQFPLP